MKLPGQIIGIDVETTSLDPATGEIIDVAAIRYDQLTGQEIDRFESLCKPKGAITSEISALTGITNEMVADKPNFSQVLEQLQQFIGEDTLFAHNADFDTRWLTYHGLNVAKNKVVDTFMLATVAWPEASSYNLGMLAAELTLTIDGEHRAGADVALTWQLLRRIQSELAVSGEALAKIERLLRAVGAEQYLGYFAARPAASPASVSTVVAPVVPAGSLPTLDEAFGDGGRLTQGITGYSPRAGQQTMAQQVTATFGTQGSVALIEAGTGTGKTYAYVVPALLSAAAGTPVVISTYTKHLQDQLVEHDIPTVMAALGVTVKVAVVKGRANYVCDARLGQLIERVSNREYTPAISFTEAIFLIKILRWLDNGGSGDLEKMNASHQGQRSVRLIHADSGVCRLGCKQRASCPYTKSKRAQDGAQLMVVNHALLTQLGTSGNGIVNSAGLVIDEAHHLEEASRRATALDLTRERIEELADTFITLARHSKAEKTGDRIIVEAEQLVSEYAAWVEACGKLVLAQSRSREILLTAALRKGSAWQKLAGEAAGWRGRLKFIVGFLRSLEAHHTGQDKVVVTEGVRAAERFGIEFQNFIEGSTERVQWISVYEPMPGVVKTYLHDVALSVQPVFAALYGGAKGTILTSATLTTHGNFAYIKQRLGITQASEMIIPTPFDYRSNMLIYLIDDGPLPFDPIYDKYLYKAIYSLATLLHGRLLALFTSQASVKLLYNYLIRPLYKANIKVYAQKITGGRHNMLDKFRRIPESVLLGTLSFWEGIDIPGESLSCVVIPKLSFPSPKDPVVMAVAEHDNLNAFTDLAVPEMVLRLRQGVGRLLRSKDDRGVVVILDPRLHRQAYGDEVLKSLPPATIHIGSGADLLAKVTEWFGEAQLKKWAEPALKK